MKYYFCTVFLQECAKYSKTPIYRGVCGGKEITAKIGVRGKSGFCLVYIMYV